MTGYSTRTTVVLT